jgi:hypothetical protein
MTITDTGRQKLEDKISLLQKELNQAQNALNNMEYERKEELYGNKFNCCYCRYNAVNDFSADGWHNLCGKKNCTCCNSNCEKYEPDDEFSLFIKKNVHLSGLSMFQGYIDFEEHRALKTLLRGDPFEREELQEKAIQILTTAFIKENSNG